MNYHRALRVSDFLVVPLIASILLFLPTILMAGETPERLAKVDAAVDLVTFEPQIAHNQMRVTVSGPGGFQIVRSFEADEPAGIDLPGADGLYKYELRFSPVLDRETSAALAAARKAGQDLNLPVSGMVQSGSFSIRDGSLVGDRREAEAKVVLTTAEGVIRNSLCVGFDCPNSPVFDDSTILMMENNTRIKFGDTSASPFPNNDWEIEANSSLSGGANYLGFNDCGTADNDGGCATDLVFAVEAGARASALYVESDGDIGVGTSNPVVDLHIVTGNTPTLRLDQDGSSGFTPQVWDVAGNETNFFIRDVTGGSSLPFRIRPGAPSSAIFIDVDGDVGLGTAAPAADTSLHVVANTGAANDVVFMQNNGPTRFALSNTSAGDVWRFNYANSGELRIGDNDANVEFQIDGAGNVTISGGLITTGGGGACTGADPCDGIFSPEFDLPTIEEHAAEMWEKSHLPAVGPTGPDQPINLTVKTLRMLNELEKAHIYIEQLNDTLKAQKAAIESLENRLAEVENQQQ